MQCIHNTASVSTPVTAAPAAIATKWLRSVTTDSKIETVKTALECGADPNLVDEENSLCTFKLQ